MPLDIHSYNIGKQMGILLLPKVKNLCSLFPVSDQRLGGVRQKESEA